MEELENKHTSEVAKLQKQIDALDNQIIRLQMSNSKRYALILDRFLLTAIIFESEPMSTPWKFLAGSQVIPNFLSRNSLRRKI